MRILVVEDKPSHRESAQATLSGHDLTIVDTYRKAINLLVNAPNFDVVLTDMMMPISPDAKQGRDNPGEQVPYGFIIALKATLCGVRFVAMVTDTCHHVGAMSAALDHLDPSNYDSLHDEIFSPNFQINNARVMFVHSPILRKYMGPKACDLCSGSGSCPSGRCPRCDGRGQIDNIEERKDWGRVLSDLTAA
ncbi:MAG: hypothetical protein HY461_01735 [Parcubacteria group bacterium]|nr:hypothetical protein [Parcubacteria group bacterium]